MLVIMNSHQDISTNTNASTGPNRSKIHGDPFTHRRLERERAERVSRNRKAGIILAGTVGVGLLGAGVRERHQDNDVLENPPATTTVIAEPGDNIGDLQKAEGPGAGNSMQQTIDDAVRLNQAADQDNDPKIYPGDEVILVDNQANNHQG